ncbi:hypothetical protein [Viridibacillus arvi]
MKVEKNWYKVIGLCCLILLFTLVIAHYSQPSYDLAPDDIESTLLTT